jgi:D-tyrosyl-tRNA(Tyr) deacylase
MIICRKKRRVYKMRFVIQRVSKAQVIVDKSVVGKINKGFVVLIGVTHSDTKEIADVLIKKLMNLRVFSDDNDKMNLSLNDVNDGELLLISQFTLYADCKKGNRPSFIQAAKPVPAEKLYNYIIEKCKETGINVQTGIFGADMKVELINDGPVTIILDSEQL